MPHAPVCNCGYSCWSAGLQTDVIIVHVHRTLTLGWEAGAAMDVLTRMGNFGPDTDSPEQFMKWFCSLTFPKNK